MSYVSWVNHCSSNLNQKSFLDCTMDLGLEQLVTKPTRDDAILDLILVDCERAIFDTDVIAPFSTSEHNTVIFHINLDYNIHTSELNSYYKLNYNSLSTKLKNFCWTSSLDEHSTVESLWSYPGGSYRNGCRIYGISH